MQKTVAKINLDGLRRNAQTFMDLAGVPLIAVVKANAYGHGAEETVCALQGIAHGFAVCLLEEGLSVKTAACGKDILVFTPPTDENQALLMMKNAFLMTVSDIKSARLIDGVCKRVRLPARVHLKCNTGMNRYGMLLPALGKACKLLRENPWIHVEGLYSHLYAHDEETANAQRIRFLAAQELCKWYFPHILSHLSATYGCLLGQPFAFDAVRVGLGLYGYLPDDVPAERLPLQKVMQVYARCVDERQYSSGGAGYTNFVPNGVHRLRTVRYGYADGSPWLCTREERLSTCMDACVCIGDTKRLKGSVLPVMTDARESASYHQTTCYEILCRASARAEYVYGYYR